MPEETMQSDLVELARLPASEADRVLRRLRTEQIHFVVKIDDSALTNMSPVAADSGGLYGTALMIVVLVEPGDLDAALAALKHANGQLVP